METVEQLNPVPKSRRALLAAAAAAAGGWIAAALGRNVPSAKAAAGDPLIVGSETNNAGTSDTQLIANSNVVTFKLYQQGPGTALMGYTTPTTGTTRGVYGRVDSPNGAGVQGRNAGTAGTGAAVQAIGVNNNGVDATTDSGSKYAVKGVGGNGTAIYGQATQVGVHGQGYSGVYGTVGAAAFAAKGVYGNGGSGTDNMGVYGTVNASGGKGVYGNNSATSGNAIGVHGKTASASGYAGYFEGNLHTTGALSKGSGSFKIDHPLDPANKYLFHSFVESPEMLNVYSGIAELGPDGRAEVMLPTWFGALNREVRYQLTAVGAPMPQLYISDEVRDNCFSIGGGIQGKRVSWQLTGVRQDAYARAHPVPVEVEKPEDEKGTYLHPDAFGLPADMSLSHRLDRTLVPAG
jgi:hypothetical protein